MERLLNSIAKVRQSVLSDGISGTALKIFHRIRVLSVLHGFHFVLIGLDPATFEKNDSPSRSSSMGGGELEFREIRQEELTQLHFAEGMFTLETFNMHFSKDMRFFAAFHKGTVISVNGINTRLADLVYIKMPDLPLSDGIAYLNCALTVPTYRNRSIGTELRSFMLRQMMREGIRTVFAAIFVDNNDALRWNLRNGFQYLGKIYYLKCGRFKFHLRCLNQNGSRYRRIFNGARRESKQAMAEVA